MATTDLRATMAVSPYTISFYSYIDPITEKRTFLCLYFCSNAHNWTLNKIVPVASDCWANPKAENIRCKSRYLYFPPSVLKKAFRYVPSGFAKSKARFATPIIILVTSSLYTKNQEFKIIYQDCELPYSTRLFPASFCPIPHRPHEENSERTTVNS